MSNRKDGTTFEREFCTLLSLGGFWAHNLAQKASGQPFDIICAKDGNAYVVDCKVCKNDFFDTRRIEDNQRLAMTRWRECYGYTGWFAIKVSNGQIYMISLNAIDQFLRDTGKRIMTIEYMEKFGYTLERWLEIY